MIIIGRPILTHVFGLDTEKDYLNSESATLFIQSLGKVMGVLISAYWQKVLGKLNQLFLAEIFNLISCIFLVTDLQCIF